MGRSIKKQFGQDMKRFYLQRNADASGVSGIGRVAEGCQFDTGWCALVWLTGKSAMSYYPDIETLENIHGHEGMTRIVWVDGESSNFVIERKEVQLGVSRKQRIRQKR